MPEIITMGELLIDFIPAEKDCKLKDVNSFKKAAGGAPANVAAALGRIGEDVGFIGKIGSDAFGDFLEETLLDHGVDLKYLLRTEKAMTTLAFVSLTGEGERDFAFYRKPGADMLLAKSELDSDCLAGTEIFHFGTISLTDQPVRAATYYLLELAVANGVFISFDPNIRLPLWDNDFISFKEEFKQVLPYLDLLKLNLDELALLTGVDLSEGDLNQVNQALENKLLKGAQELMVQGPNQIIVTAGKFGSFYCGDDKVVYQPAEKVEVVDTTGAGDAFMAGIISEIVREIKADNLARIDWVNTLAAANKFGAITSSRYGAIPALPAREEIL